MMSGIPVQRIAEAEGKRLMHMGQDLKGKVIGQDEAIAKIVKAIKRDRKELLVGNKEIIMVYIRRFIPGLYHKIVTKINN